MKYPTGQVIVNQQDQFTHTTCESSSDFVIDLTATRHIKWQQWAEANREGMEEVAQFIGCNGSFADENRSW